VYRVLKLRELQKRFANTPVVAVGLTAIQGVMLDSEDEAIDTTDNVRKEMEMMGNYIGSKHNTWDIALHHVNQQWFFRLMGNTDRLVKLRVPIDVQEGGFFGCRLNCCPVITECFRNEFWKLSSQLRLRAACQSRRTKAIFQSLLYIFSNVLSWASILVLAFAFSRQVSSY